MLRKSIAPLTGLAALIVNGIATPALAAASHATMSVSGGYHPPIIPWIVIFVFVYFGLLFTLEYLLRAYQNGWFPFNGFFHF